MELGLMSLLQVYGPLGIIVGFFLMQDWHREKRRAKEHEERRTHEREREDGLVRQLQEIECWIKQTLVELIRENQRVVSSNTHAMNEHARALRRFQEYLEKLGFQNGEKAKEESEFE